MAIVRAIAAVIIGYIVIAVVVMATFSAAWAVMKANGAFEQGTYTVSTGWIVVTSVLGLIAAIIGGLVCALIAVKGSKAPIALICVVLILGIGQLIGELAVEVAEPQERTADISMLEAMANAESPMIALVLNPIIGAVGVLVGSRIRGKGSSAE